MDNLKTRLFKEKIAKGFMRLSGMLVTGSLFFIIGTILYKGLPYLSWEMVSQLPKGGFYMGSLIYCSGHSILYSPNIWSLYFGIHCSSRGHSIVSYDLSNYDQYYG